MDGERWQRVREVFQAALERDATEWPALVAEACGEDGGLRAEVESLLSAHRAAEGFLAGPQDAGPEIDALLGRRIGPYQIAQRLGSGGMGVVYLAFRADREYRLRVALKVLKPGLDSEEVIRRFRAERQILAALVHPNIARLLDGGTTERGLPYFAMEYVAGQPINAYCAERHLGVDERLELFLTVCSAVEHAHRNLVVHRDLKPSNILVTAEGIPKLLDFGIAKLVNPEMSSATLPMTALGLQPMTPDYASPEQVRGEHVTTASDVYSLGLLLYELLTGDHPYRSRASSLAEMQRLITEEEPEPPSLAVMRHGESSGEAAALGPAIAGRRRLRRELVGDLDNIVLKALQKDPKRRYGSVEQLSEDLRRHRERLPVTARRSTAAYRAGRFIRRHRVGVAAAAGLLVAILGFGIAMGALAVQLSRERDRADRERRRAEQVTSFLTSIFEVSDPRKSPGKTVTARALLDAGAGKLTSGLAEQPEVRAELMRTVGTIYRSLGLFDSARPLLESALAERRRLFGDRHAKVAESWNDIALLAQETGDLAGAEASYRKALALRRELLGPGHPEVAQSLSDLAGIFWATGRYDEAETAFREALALRRKAFGDRHPDVAKSLNGLGIVLWSRGRYGESIRVLSQALALRRQLLGSESLEVADGLNNLALPLQAQGDFARAESLHREALSLWTKRLGDRHPRVATGLHNLGIDLLEQGKAAEAEPLLRRGLSLRRELLGDDHPEVAQSLVKLADAALARHDFAAAEALARESLTVNRRLFGEENTAVAGSLEVLGRVRQAQGDRVDAEALLRQRLAMLRKLLGSANPEVASALMDLADLLAASGDPAAGEAAAGEAVQILRSALPAGNWRLAEAESVRGSCLAGRRRYAEAEAVLLRSLERLAAACGETAPSTRRTLERLVALYESIPAPEKATQYRRRLSATRPPV